MALFGGRDRLVFPLCGGVGTVRVVGIAVCADGREAGAVAGHPSHLES